MRRLPLVSLALIPVLAIVLPILACGGLWVVVLACSGLLPLSFSPDELPDAQTGEAYQVSIQVSQNDTPVGQFSIVDGRLPQGLTLAPIKLRNAAVISGTPEVAGRYRFTVRASCLSTQVTGQSGQQAYTLVVK